MTIKHLVLSGGGYKGLYSLGALYKLSQKKFYSMKNIESIFATSIGSVLGVILILELDWHIVLDYIIRRPWHKTFEIPSDMLFKIIGQKGILNIDIFISILEKLFHAKELDIKTITLREFYTFSNIEFHLFSLQLNKFQVESFSYLTHPDLKLIEAIYMSCSIPFIFQPLFYQNTYRIDGGILCNFPFQQCLNKFPNKEEILAIYIQSNKVQKEIPQDSNLFTYWYYLFDSLILHSNRNVCEDIPHQVIIPVSCSDTDTLHKLINEEKEREHFIEEGKKYADLFLSYKNSQGSVEKLS